MRTKNVEIISARTAAVVNTAAKLVTNKYDTVIVSATVLAGAEEVDVYILSGGVMLVVTDSAGDAVKLTATAPSVTLEGGPMYAFAKDSTVGQCALKAVLRRTSSK
jgi:flavoprotein